MNDEEITKRSRTEQNEIRPTQQPVNAALDDPYAEDFVWDPEVSPETNALAPEPVFETDPYDDAELKDFTSPADLYAEPAVEEPVHSGSQPFAPLPYTPESTDETVRKSGLAYSIGIVFVVSVAFMLLLGWIADWMFGTKPWGLVAGIVLGSIIGFVQVVRISSRIFTPNKNGPAISPLMSHVKNDAPMEQVNSVDQAVNGE